MASLRINTTLDRLQLNQLQFNINPRRMPNRTVQYIPRQTTPAVSATAAQSGTEIIAVQDDSRLLTTDPAMLSEQQQAMPSPALATSPAAIESETEVISANAQIQGQLQTSTSFDTFHPFPRLTSELRLQIWEMALPGPRIVEARLAQNLQHWYSPIDSFEPASVLLHVNKESRSVFAFKYQPVLLWETSLVAHRNDPRIAKYEKERCARLSARTSAALYSLVWFNPEVDTLFVKCDPAGQLLPPHALDSLHKIGNLGEAHSLALCYTWRHEMTWLAHDRATNDLQKFLAFKNLKELTVVMDEYYTFPGRIEFGEHLGDERVGYYDPVVGYPPAMRWVERLGELAGPERKINVFFEYSTRVSPTTGIVDRPWWMAWE